MPITNEFLGGITASPSVLTMSEVNGRPNSIDMTSTENPVFYVVFIKDKEVRHSVIPIITPKIMGESFALEMANGIMLNGIIPITVNADETTCSTLKSGCCAPGIAPRSDEGKDNTRRNAIMYFLEHIGSSSSPHDGVLIAEPPREHIRKHILKLERPTKLQQTIVNVVLEIRHLSIGSFSTNL